MCQMCAAACDGDSFSPVLLSPCFWKRADLKRGVTDSGLRALASAGCGEKLTSLTLFCEFCCVPVCELMVDGNGRGHAGCVLLAVYDGDSFSLVLSFPCFCQRADLEAGVTDSGLRALASAGCGGKLTSLNLWGECCCVPVCDLTVRGSEVVMLDVCCCL